MKKQSILFLMLILLCTSSILAQSRSRRVTPRSPQPLTNYINATLLKTLKIGFWQHSVAFSPSSKTVAIGWAQESGNDGGLEIWNIITWNLEWKPIENARVLSVAFSPDGGKLACGITRYFNEGEHKDEVQIWDIYTSKLKWTATAHNEDIRSVVFSPDSKTLVSGGGKEINLWDVQTGRLIRTHNVAEEVHSVTFSPDGGTVASGRNQADGTGVVELWDTRTGYLKRTLKGHGDTVTSVAFSPEGQTIVSSSNWWGGGSGNKVGELRLWNAQSGDLKLARKFGDETISAIAFSPNGKIIALACKSDLRLMNIETGEVKRVPIRWTPDWSHAAMTSVTFSLDGKMLAGAGTDNQVWFWDIRETK